MFVAKEKQRSMSKKWSDHISNLWHQEHLRFLWSVAIPFTEETPVFEYDPDTGLYGYQFGSDEEPEENEDLFIQADSSVDSPETSMELANTLQDKIPGEGYSYSRMQPRDSKDVWQHATDETHTIGKKGVCV